MHYEVTKVPADRCDSLPAVLSILLWQVGFFAAERLSADCLEHSCTAQVLYLLDVPVQAYESPLLFSAKNTTQMYHLQMQKCYHTSEMHCLWTVSCHIAEAAGSVERKEPAIIRFAYLVHCQTLAAL